MRIECSHTRKIKNETMPQSAWTHHGAPLDEVKREVELTAGVNAVFLDFLDAAAPDAQYLVCDATHADASIVACSQAWLNVCGYRPEHVLGRPNCRFLQGPDTDYRSIAEMASSINAGHVCNASIVNYHRDGSKFVNKFVMGPLVDAAGAPRFYVSIHGTPSRELDWSLARSPVPCYRVSDLGSPEGSPASLQRQVRSSA